MDDQIITEQLEFLSPEYREWLKSGYIENAAADIALSNNLDEEKTVELENGVTLYFLLLLNRVELVEYLVTKVELEEMAAKAAVQKVLQPLPAKFIQKHEQLLSGQLPAVQVPEPEPDRKYTHESPIIPKATETDGEIAEPIAVPPMRTMASDMQANREPEVETPTLSQDELLKKKDSPAQAKVVEAPLTASVPKPPSKWETE